jgi:hypothetical protein
MSAAFDFGVIAEADFLQTWVQSPKLCPNAWWILFPKTVLSRADLRGKQEKYDWPVCGKRKADQQPKPLGLELE